MEEKRLWKRLADMPPVGYDPGLFWKDVNDPRFGVLKLMPWRDRAVDPRRDGAREAADGVERVGVGFSTLSLLLESNLDRMR